MSSCVVLGCWLGLNHDAAIKTQLSPALQTPSIPQVYNLPQTASVSSQISEPKKQVLSFAMDVLCGPAPSSPTPAPVFHLLTDHPVGGGTNTLWGLQGH